MKIIHSKHYSGQQNTKNSPTVFTVYCGLFYIYLYFFFKIGYRQTLRLSGQDVLWNMS